MCNSRTTPVWGLAREYEHSLSHTTALWLLQGSRDPSKVIDDFGTVMAHLQSDHSIDSLSDLLTALSLLTDSETEPSHIDIPVTISHIPNVVEILVDSILDMPSILPDSEDSDDFIGGVLFDYDNLISQLSSLQWEDRERKDAVDLHVFYRRFP